MSLFDTFRDWRSPKRPATNVDQNMRLLLRNSVEIVSAYGAVLEHEYGSIKTLTTKRPEEDLPFSKEQILGAIAILQEALRKPSRRAVLKEILSPIEAQQVLSTQFENGLQVGLMSLDSFVSAAEYEAECGQLAHARELLDKIDPATRKLIEAALAAARRNDDGKK